MEDHQHGAERAGKSQPRVWPTCARAEPSRSLAEDDDNFRQEADEEGRYWMDARSVVENGAFTLPLEAGDNEVAVAIANNFFGWGLMLRLADPEGVHLAAK